MVDLHHDKHGTNQGHDAEADLGATADGASGGGRSRGRRGLAGDGGAVEAAGIGRDAGGGVDSGRSGVVSSLGSLDRRLLNNGRRGLGVLLDGDGRDLGMLNGRAGRMLNRAGGVLNRAGGVLNGTGRVSDGTGRVLDRSSRVLNGGTGRDGLTLARAVGRGDDLGGDAADRAVGDRGRALGDGVSGVVSGGESLRVVGRRVGGLRRLGSLGSTGDRADGGVQRNGLGGNVAALVRAVNPRRALGDGADCRGVHGRGGHLSGGSRGSDGGGGGGGDTGLGSTRLGGGG